MEIEQMIPACDKKKVLLVDANAEVLSLICALLEHYGHEVRTANTGAKALSHACELRPDVIFTGLSLPDCTGYELAQRFRATPESASSFIVALSGYTPMYCYDDHKAAGFDHRLVKPVNIDQIVETITFLSKHGVATGPADVHS